MVEYKLPKLGVAGSTPVARSSCVGENVCFPPLFEVIRRLDRLVYFELRTSRRLFCSFREQK
ncbi:hypothetical protein PITCH_A390023 [uncultured Desulfobacterium sp.]|uniref:Uncharacterized protein n=1 Tax=uncultured Desulfobacterium sp. TaxID=201089 RepID=A0A445MZL9_9BACT|nr:hypothetical protein PITCH_A390023 [uncultured Desulfobacterium sp.]